METGTAIGDGAIIASKTNWQLSHFIMMGNGGAGGTHKAKWLRRNIGPSTHAVMRCILPRRGTVHWKGTACQIPTARATS